MNRRLLATTIRVALAVALYVPGVALAGRSVNGTYTLPSGNPVVGGTTITKDWANNTLSDIATALTDSVSRSGKGGFQSPAMCVDGAVGAPGLTFGNETTTGFFRIATNDVGLTIGGTKRWEHTAAGQIETGWAQFAGTVTVGGSISSTGAKLSLIAPPSFDVEISASTSVSFAVKADGTNDNKARRLVNVADPVSAQDAATKNYVDAVSSSDSPSLGADWGGSIAVKRTGKIVSLTLKLTNGGMAAWSSVATLSAGFRPSIDVYAPCAVLDSSAAFLYPALAYIDPTTGVMSIADYDNGTSYALPFATSVGDAIYLTTSFPVP